ncbi:TolC family protein [Pseudoxanthomonas wuyuanensis]|uniref:Uncharacterized protein n=1 Tax=Pseudoxanthomonas wuyuanensis TaxID=1073196 RepID=A0A286DH28_9GAMM|nr:TolC family protein [Pseudoxanthomonas wuyuanensis]KAF1717218.1 TolC family protein [Pseudoxanthomonas wuyuanensis]SOD57920.1 hypothetical protein SAMN06296416_1208 [Pseudoxanthomonas wuyuanensis]
MISIQPSNESPHTGRAGHAAPSPSGKDAPPGPARFFHGGSPQPCDEAQLAHWWDRAGLDHLGALIRTLLVQSIGLSQAHLQLKEAIDALEPPDDGVRARARAMHLGIAAMAAFQMERVRTIARCARAYVDYLIVADRLRNLEGSIALQRIIVRKCREDADADREELSFAVSASIAEMHAAQERMRGSRDQALLVLCNELGEPVEATYRRVHGHALPEEPAQIPGTGTPECLARRRPDLIGALHGVCAAELAPPETASMQTPRARLAHEHAVASAENEVECALRALRARISELVPLRASTAAAETMAWKTRESVNAGKLPNAALSGANFLLCARRDREIEVRGDSYLALIGLFEALGAGWESGPFLQADAGDASA